MRLNPIDGLLYLSMRLMKSFDTRATNIRYFNPDKVRNILVVSSTAIGDTLLSTPAIRAVRERYPEAKIIAHFKKKNLELFENNPHIDGIVPYYGGYRKFFKTVKELRKHRFDLVLILHGNEPQATPVAYLSGAPVIVKLPNNSRFSFLLSNREPEHKWDCMHGIERRLKIATLINCRGASKRMELFIDCADDEVAEEFIRAEGVGPGEILIGFQAGASTLSRMWFADRFIELGKRLLKEYPQVRIVIIGSPAERDLCEDIAKGINESVMVAAGKLKLRQVAALIKRLTVLVSGDTGPMHMAVSLGTSVVALYAVANSRISGPYCDIQIHTVIQKQKTCDPCVSKKCEYQECMENISVDEVYDAVKGVMAIRL